MLQENVIVLVAEDETSGAVLSYDCLAKGPGVDWVVGQLARDLGDWGRRDVCLQIDGEPAMLALQQAIAKARKGDTVLRNSLAYNPQSTVELKRLRRTSLTFMRRIFIVFSMCLCTVFCIAFARVVAFRSIVRSLSRRPNYFVSF